jgi:hypothetical protein
MSVCRQSEPVESRSRGKTEERRNEAREHSTSGEQEQGQDEAVEQSGSDTAPLTKIEMLKAERQQRRPLQWRCRR